MINDLLSPPHPRPSPPVFDDPRGHRRKVLTAAGALACLLCVCVLAVLGGVLYAEPNAPATSPAEATHTTPRR
ncbi:hypothetical protein ABT084_18245 [Streptomyces sp. NPDC002138]|uniref:hypothetical protein n=1 Tax=Streptomyces sp. NPDC002138 TaxID=3154410 RepID=UPI00332C93E3